MAENLAILQKIRTYKFKNLSKPKWENSHTSRCMSQTYKNKKYKSWQ